MRSLITKCSYLHKYHCLPFYSVLSNLKNVFAICKEGMLIINPLFSTDYATNYFGPLLFILFYRLAFFVAIELIRLKIFYSSWKNRFSFSQYQNCHKKKDQNSNLMQQYDLDNYLAIKHLFISIVAWKAVCHNVFFKYAVTIRRGICNKNRSL